jgi:lipopolysaccharide export system permease protein
MVRNYRRIMPILWRYLLRSYFRVLLLCAFGFVAILLVSRSQDIARFASSGAPLKAVLLFALYQIPYILPLALPISCLIATLLLFKRLSHTHELTALRTAGLGLQMIISPILMAGFFLSVANFSIVSELAPYCRILSKKLIYEVTETNPLFLLQKGTLIKLKETFIDMRILKTGRRAEDVIVILNNHSQGRLSLISAKELSLEKDQLKGEYVTLISNLESNREEGFDHLVIENQKTMETKASNLSQFIQNTDWYSNYDYLSFKMALAKESYDKRELRKGLLKQRARIELSRRISLGMAAFTFTVIGTAFGMEISRNRKKRGLFTAILLSALFLTCFITAKSWHYSSLIPPLIYLLPHPFILLFCFRAYRRVSRGIE